MIEEAWFTSVRGPVCTALGYAVLGSRRIVFRIRTVSDTVRRLILHNLHQA
jgi:hypothetical protein